ALVFPGRQAEIDLHADGMHGQRQPERHSEGDVQRGANFGLVAVEVGDDGDLDVDGVDVTGDADGVGGVGAFLAHDEDDGSATVGEGRLSSGVWEMKGWLGSGLRHDGVVSSHGRNDERGEDHDEAESDDGGEVED
ncbi:MAG: hypothetical protein Q9187_008206, partial [Circinaria calcarea]